jgi:hypothetical protein
MALTWAFISFKKFLSVSNISKKKEHVACKTQNLATAVAGKMGSLIFLIQNLIFDLKHLKKHPRDIVKPIHDHQKANKPFQNLKSTRNKNSS